MRSVSRSRAGRVGAAWERSSRGLQEAAAAASGAGWRGHVLGCGCLCNQLPSRQPPRSSGGRLSRASSPLANRAAQGSRRPHPADAPRAKGAKRSPLRLLQGSGNLESSPTRHTRDRLLKVVPAAARVSLHRLVNPPRAPRPRPLSGVAASPAAHFSFRPSGPGHRRAPPSPGRAGPGPRAVRPFAFSPRPGGGGARWPEDRAGVGRGEPNPSSNGENAQPSRGPCQGGGVHPP